MSHFTGFHETGTVLRLDVADGDNLDVRVLLEAERRAEPADAVPGDSDLDLAVGNGLPFLLAVLFSGEKRPE